MKRFAVLVLLILTASIEEIAAKDDQPLDLVSVQYL